MGFRQLIEYYKLTSTKTKGKDQMMKNICYRISDKAKRQLGQALRMLRVHAKEEFERARKLIKRQRGIMNRMVDANARLMSAGFNKLIEDAKLRTAQLREKLKFVIKTLTDQDA